MTKPALSSWKLVIAVVLFGTSTMSHASDFNRLFNLRTIVSDDGISIAVPTISQQEIYQTLQQAQQQLNNNTKRLKKIIQANSPSGSNLLMAAIMPGGLLYLAYQQKKVAIAEKQLNSTHSEIIELGYDEVSLTSVASAVPFQQANRPIIVARYP